MTTAHVVPRLAPPRYVQPEAEPRHVRVTVDGLARPLSHAPNLLRIQLGGRTVVVDTNDPDVLVEYPEPAREWTDGDVILTPHTVWRRDNGRWHSAGGQVALDADLEHELANPDKGWRVLRYQHGGDA